MIIFYYFGLYWISIMLIGVWYSILRKGLRDKVLLPANVTRCSFRKIDVEISRLQAIDENHPAIVTLGIVKKLFIASWVTIAVGPLGIIWIITFS